MMLKPVAHLRLFWLHRLMSLWISFFFLLLIFSPFLFFPLISYLLSIPFLIIFFLPSFLPSSLPILPPFLPLLFLPSVFFLSVFYLFLILSSFFPFLINISFLNSSILWEEYHSIAENNIEEKETNFLTSTSSQFIWTWLEAVYSIDLMCLWG